jgi:hypothetical protein
MCRLLFACERGSVPCRVSLALRCAAASGPGLKGEKFALARSATAGGVAAVGRAPGNKCLRSQF